MKWLTLIGPSVVSTDVVGIDGVVCTDVMIQSCRSERSRSVLKRLNPVALLLLEVDHFYGWFMKIQTHALVTIHIKMHDAQGELLEESAQPLTYLHGHQDIFPLVEEALEGKGVGDTLTVYLEPEDAFGDYDAELVLLAPLEALGEGVEVGSRVEGEPDTDDEEEGGARHPNRIFTVTDIGDGKAVLDGNHPLAGLAIRLDVNVLDVRPATPEELAESDVATVPSFLSVTAPDGSRYQ